MTIWSQDSLSAPGSCKGEWDFKLHYRKKKQIQQQSYTMDEKGTMEDIATNEVATDEEVTGELCHNGCYREVRSKNSR